MKRLNIDLETYSSVSLDDAGVYKYAESPDFEIQLFAVSVDKGPVVVYDLANGDTIPDEIIQALTDPTVEKHAFNAQFERICLSRYIGMETGTYIDPSNWRCTQAKAQSVGLAASLKACGEMLDIKDKKLDEGRDLVLFFSKPTSKGEKHLPKDYPEKWERYKAYNLRDVEAELEVEEKSGIEMLSREQEIYELDQRINDTGVRIDVDLCQKAIEADSQYLDIVYNRLLILTGLDNPRSTQQFLNWLNTALAEVGHKPAPNVQKATLEALAKELEGDDDKTKEIKEVLELKSKLSKTSTKKFQKMIDCVNSDGRARGLFKYMGAPKTGRFAGRQIQLQNLTKNKAPNILEIRKALKDGGYDGLAQHGDVSNLLSQLVRSAIIPNEGCVFVDADYSAIEARVLAWLANEAWRLEAFEQGKDIYCESASKIYGVPVVKNGENGHLRAKGKVAELACGYGGGVGAMKAFDDSNMPDDELLSIVRDWRDASPNVCGYWRQIDDAIKNRLKAPKEKTPKDRKDGMDVSGKEGVGKETELGHEKAGKTTIEPPMEWKIIKGAGNCKTGVRVVTEDVYAPAKDATGKVIRDENNEVVYDKTKLVYKKPDSLEKELFIKLPSGRNLIYTKVGLDQRDGFEEIQYTGYDSGRLKVVDTYGAKLVENITQGTARDLLCEAMLGLYREGFTVIAHIHDEVIVEVDIQKCKESLARVCEIMGTNPKWAQGICVTAEGYLSPCLLKDGFDDTAFLKEMDDLQIPEPVTESIDDIKL